MPGLYWILLWFLLLVYCGFSLLGRFNEKLKSIIFDSFDVDTGFHIFRYTIMPIFIFILLTVILLMRIISGTMDYGYGSPKLLIKVIVIVIVFVVCVEIGGDGVYFVLGRIAREEPVDAGCGGFSLVIAAEAAREECSGCEQETAHHENGEGAAHRILRHENPPLFAAG